MSINIFEEINIKFPKDEKKIVKAFESCKIRNKFIEIPKDSYKEHLEMAKDDLVSLNYDFNKENWRWTIIKSYYSIFHATNALLINKLGFFSKDHLCAILALKYKDLMNDNIYLELGKIYEKFSDIFGFALMFEARKLSQYSVTKWKNLTKKEADIAKRFAKKFVSYVEGECK